MPAIAERPKSSDTKALQLPLGLVVRVIGQRDHEDAGQRRNLPRRT
jgi:hypothetical protein